MKLYLTSIGVPKANELLKLLDNTQPLSVAVIPTAWNVYPKERKEQEIDKTKRVFSDIGLTPTVIDIAETNAEQLKETLEASALIWVMGGNSFYLNYHINRSGLQGILRPLLESGTVYGGESAGAVIACPTLHGVELVDNPNEAPEIIWSGFALVDFGIVPHWGHEKYASLLEQCKLEMEKYASVTTLTDEQVLIVNGNKVSIL